MLQGKLLSRHVLRLSVRSNKDSSVEMPNLPSSTVIIGVIQISSCIRTLAILSGSSVYIHHVSYKMNGSFAQLPALCFILTVNFPLKLPVMSSVWLKYKNNVFQQYSSHLTEIFTFVQLFFEDNIDDAKYCGRLYGLGSGSSQPQNGISSSGQEETNNKH